MLTAFGLMSTRIAEIHKRIQPDIGDSENMTAATAITSIGTTKLFVLFVAERHTASTTVASGNVDKCFIDKFHGVWP